VSTSGGPSFAYDLCARRVTDEEAAGLDLASWRIAFNGAEPVRADVIERFVARFATRGFRREAIYPCYGLAESTLMVTGSVPLGGPRALEVDRGALAGWRAVPRAGGRALVGCGRPAPDHELAIVDGGAPLPAWRVGEIWVAGASVAAGYWREPDAGFGARLPGRDRVFLRTGDLGFVDDSGELYVVGRCKDLIIVRGCNHYPEDLERTLEAASDSLRPGFGVVFGVEQGGEERVIAVHELAGKVSEHAKIAGDLVQAVAARHGLRLHDAILVRPGTIPKTSSGKLRRAATRELYLAGRLEAIGV